MHRSRCIAVLILFALLLPCMAQERLQYHDDGTFRIVQFTDFHLAGGHWSNFMVWDNLDNAVQTQKPDLIVVTGDNIYSSPAEAIFTEMLDSLDATGIPYTLIFGNHDRQFDLSGPQLLDIARKRPNCLVDNVPGIHGDGNHFLEIYGGDKVSTVLYFFDSGDTSPLSKKAVPEYDYDFVRSSQIEWYGALSSWYTEINGGLQIPSLAFLHIPFPEYKEIPEIKGNRGEPVCSSHVNSGLFAKFLEMGDVRAVFCGHDHDNDYSGPLYSILLAYGRYSGGKAEYNNLEPNGCRVIDLRDFGAAFDTFIALSDGSEIH